eukprot:jgi/Ulvmu1/8778/UM048_0033.1
MWSVLYLYCWAWCLGLERTCNSAWRAQILIRAAQGVSAPLADAGDSDDEVALPQASQSIYTTSGASASFCIASSAFADVAAQTERDGGLFACLVCGLFYSCQVLFETRQYETVDSGSDA